MLDLADNQIQLNGCLALAAASGRCSALECLSLAAYHMRARLWFNKTAYMMTQYRLEIATDLEAAANLETALIAGVHGVMAPPQPPGKLGAVPTWGKGLQAEQAAQESPPQEA